MTDKIDFDNQKEGLMSALNTQQYNVILKGICVTQVFNRVKGDPVIHL